jgi:regulatory protein
MQIIITKIDRQKKNKGRYSLYTGEKFIAGISEETLLEFDIYSGKEISENILDKIKEKEKQVAVREQAWRYLSRREHSEKELRDKLLVKGNEVGIIDRIISNLKEKDYINNERFARLLIVDEINFKKNGPLLIKNKLLKKGLEIDLVNHLLNEYYNEVQQEKNCKYLAEKKYKSLKESDINQKKSRLGNYLTQKGFTWDISANVISDLFRS